MANNLYDNVFDIESKKHSSTNLYEGYEMTDYDHHLCALIGPEHSRRKETIRLSESELETMQATELARLLTIGYVVAHGLNEIHTVDTPLESDEFIVLGYSAFNKEVSGDIRDPVFLKRLLFDHGDTTDDGCLFPE